MIVLVANLGSTSLKLKLYDASKSGDTTALASAAADRIGQGASNWSTSVELDKQSGTADFDDHQTAAAHLLKQVQSLGGPATKAIDAIGFKAVHGGPISGAVRVDENVIATMQQFADVAPAHNPPYIKAMQAFAELLPQAEQVAAFETAFHQTIPTARQVYAIPHEWIDKGIRRYGFHGASNAYIARRMKHLRPNARRIINLHLGGSCSACAILDGQSVAHSMGTTPQTGIFHANRVGEFDTYALLKLQSLGVSAKDALERLAKEGGLLGLSGISADLREIETAAAQGNAQAQLAIDAFVEACRHYLGAYAVALAGVDALVFTAGIGQHAAAIRSAICKDLAFLGITLDEDKNSQAPGNEETRISTDHSPVEAWVIPTDEEQIVAQQAVEVLAA
ncbi:acetate/propionate family kinase [Mucisphaera sp.]|uniref:acetate/propionate family kinase n=1 Tax=Mucisphaera sp. TaxID=2913024 RepID=UPI003D0DA607